MKTGRVGQLVTNISSSATSLLTRWIEDPEQTSRIKCDFVISAFGSGLYKADLKEAMEPLQMNR